MRRRAQAESPGGRRTPAGCTDRATSGTIRLRSGKRRTHVAARGAPAPHRRTTRHARLRRPHRVPVRPGTRAKARRTPAARDVAGRPRGARAEPLGAARERLGRHLGARRPAHAAGRRDRPGAHLPDRRSRPPARSGRGAALVLPRHRLLHGGAVLRRLRLHREPADRLPVPGYAAHAFGAALRRLPAGTAVPRGDTGHRHAPRSNSGSTGGMAPNRGATAAPSRRHARPPKRMRSRSTPSTTWSATTPTAAPTTGSASASWRRTKPSRPETRGPDPA